MKFKRYEPPVGKCIYCGKTAAEAGMAKLGEEHIIAFSLMGAWVLPEASCRHCGKATGRDEGYCAGEMLKAARTHFAWRSRKSKRPVTLRAGNLTGRTGASREIPVDQHPPCIVLPHFLQPGLLSNRPSDAGGIYCDGVGLYPSPEFVDRLQALGPRGSVYTLLRPEVFCRMLAKVAHAYTVAELGLGNFEAFLPEVILGQNPDFSNFVGSFYGEEPQADDLHTLGFSTMAPLIVVKVRLYARYGVPSYVVVAGRAKPR
jgi:hypothetical protein